MATRKRKSCKHGKLKKPIRTKKGGKRRCKKSKRRKRSKRRRKFKMQGSLGNCPLDTRINVKKCPLERPCLNEDLWSDGYGQLSCETTIETSERDIKTGQELMKSLEEWERKEKYGPIEFKMPWEYNPPRTTSKPDQTKNLSLLERRRESSSKSNSSGIPKLSVVRETPEEIEEERIYSIQRKNLKDSISKMKI